jgi:hypothetical protein
MSKALLLQIIYLQSKKIHKNANKIIMKVSAIWMITNYASMLTMQSIPR